MDEILQLLQDDIDSQNGKKQTMFKCTFEECCERAPFTSEYSLKQHFTRFHHVKLKENAIPEIKVVTAVETTALGKRRSAKPIQPKKKKQKVAHLIVDKDLNEKFLKLVTSTALFMKFVNDPVVLKSQIVDTLIKNDKQLTPSYKSRLLVECIEPKLASLTNDKLESEASINNEMTEFEKDFGKFTEEDLDTIHRFRNLKADEIDKVKRFTELLLSIINLNHVLFNSEFNALQTLRTILKEQNI